MATTTPDQIQTAPVQGAPQTVTVTAQPGAGPQPDSTVATTGQNVQPAATQTVVPTKVLIPAKRGGLGGIVDEFRNAIAGTTSRSVYIDPDTGERYVQNTPMTGRQQWTKLAGEALRGAAAGLAAGKGAGNQFKGLQAGVQAQTQYQQQQQQQQDQYAEQDYQRQKEAKLAMANSQLLKSQIAAAEFGLTRAQVKATQDDIGFANAQEDRERALGSADLGVYPDHVAMADVRKQLPQFWQEHYQNDSIVAVPSFDEDGKRNGVHLFLRQPGVGDDPAPKGTPAYRFVPPVKPGEQPHLEPFTPSGVHTQRELDTYSNAAYKQMQDWQASQNEAALKGAQTSEAAAGATERRAAAGKDVAETQSEKTSAAASEAKASVDASLVDEIGTGKMPVGRMGYLMARNPQLLDAVAQKYPGFDASKVESYANTYQDFTKGKTSVQLNAGETALKHLYEMSKMNTPESHIPHTAAWTAYQNKADTVSSELAKFYGDATIPAIASIKGTLTSTLPGNRQAAIATQARSMGDKLDSYEQQWKNAAPSAVYEAPMPGIDQAAKAARAALDPAYAQRSRQNAPAPAGATSAVYNAQGQLIGHGVNGKFVPLSGSGQ